MAKFILKVDWWISFSSVILALVSYSLRGFKASFLFMCFCVCVLCVQVYVAEVTADVAVCTKRNTHQRKQSEIQKVRRCRRWHCFDNCCFWLLGFCQRIAE